MVEGSETRGDPGSVQAKFKTPTKTNKLVRYRLANFVVPIDSSLHSTNTIRHLRLGRHDTHGGFCCCSVTPIKDVWETLVSALNGDDQGSLPAIAGASNRGLGLVLRDLLSGMTVCNVICP